MKRAFLVILVLLSASAVFAAPGVSFANFQSGFSEFAQDLANGAPFNSSIGLNWSQAYIGQFPHFGIGVTVGATTISPGAMKTMADALGVTLPSEFSYVSTYGLPLPAYTIDARIGGFVLPFDIGLKLGYIPPGTLEKMGLPIQADYILAGADVRFGLLKDVGFSPAFSVGVGFNHMQASVGVPGLLPSGDITVANVAGGNTLTLSNPSLQMQWSTNVLDLKVQLSKKLIFLTPYIGAAASYSFGASASGSVQSTMKYNGSAITPADIAAINAYSVANGLTPPDLSSAAIGASASSGAGFSYRVFGGLSLDLFILYIDLGGAYDISTGAYGGSLNVRLAI